MTQKQIVDIGSAFVYQTYIWAFVLGAFIVFFWLPFLALWLTLSVRGIRKELRDIAEQLALPSRRL